MVYARFETGLFLTPIYARFKTGICRILVTSDIQTRGPKKYGVRGAEPPGFFFNP